VQRSFLFTLKGDDIGSWNISASNQGMAGYKAPRVIKQLLAIGKAN
jgi:hypothetical protein